MMHELGHRMKNTLSVVLSIVTQSMRNAGSVEDARQELQSPLCAYSRAHDILVQKQWLTATFDNIVETAKEAIGWADSERIEFLGAVKGTSSPCCRGYSRLESPLAIVVNGRRRGEKSGK